MGTCCSKRNRRSDSAVHAGAVLHPSLENWKIHNRHPLSEFNDVASSGVDRIPVMWAKPTIKPPSGFPSIHYNINSNLLCESNHSSSRSLGTHTKPQPQVSLNTSKLSNEDGLLGLANHHIGSHHIGLSASSHHNSPDHEPDSYAELPPAFSFATQPYIEPDFFNNTAFAFHPATQTPRRSSVNIDSSDCIKLQVRHKHMFPEEFQALQASLICSMPPQEPSMKRSRSDGKLPEAKHAEGQHMQHHRRSFHETTIHNDICNQMRRSMPELSKASIVVGGESLSESTAQTFVPADVDDDYTDDDDDNNFHDINVGVDIDHTPMCRMYSNDELGEEGDLEDIKHCISLQVSSDSESFSMEHILKDRCARGTSKAARIMDDEEGFSRTSLKDFEFKQSTCGMSQEKMQFTWDHDYEWPKRSEAVQGDHEGDTVMMKQQLSIVSTGDAILFSGCNSDEFHLIPSRYVPHPHSPPTSPRVNLSPLKFMNACDHSPDNTSLSVEDIMLLLESDDMNEDDLLSLLINSKSSPSQSPSASISTPMSSSSSVLTSSSTSSLASSSSSSSSSSPRPWFPCPSSASPGSSSQSLLSSMPLLSPFSTTRPSASPYSLSQHPSSRRMSPHSSFEFKVKSFNSAASTPMFSPIRSTTKRNIAHLKPTVLTTEEIAEIWGVFEQRQTLLTQH